MINYSFEGLGALGVMFALVFAVLAIVVQVFFAIAVYRDAEKIVADGGKTVFVSGTWWTVAVLVGSLPAVALYWAIHHSTLRRE